MDHPDHCNRPHAWQRRSANFSLPRMGTDFIVERHRHSAGAWACSDAVGAEAIHLFPVLTIEVTASAVVSSEHLEFQNIFIEGGLSRGFRQLSPHLSGREETRSGVM